MSDYEYSDGSDSEGEGEGGHEYSYSDDDDGGGGKAGPSLKREDSVRRHQRRDAKLCILPRTSISPATHVKYYKSFCARAVSLFCAVLARRAHPHIRRARQGYSF